MPTLQESRVILPFGFNKNEPGDPYFFNISMDLNDYNSDSFNDLFSDNPKFDSWNSQRNESNFNNFRDTIFEHSDKTIPMVGFVKNLSRERTMLGLRQTFVGTVQEITKISFNPGYKYKWDKDKKLVSITYYLGSTKPKVVEEAAKKLIVECQMFFTIYTEEGKKILKHMV